MPTLLCLGCDRKYEGPISIGFCVPCTMENLKANGVSCSIAEIIRFGPAINRNPHLIVKLVAR
jgi:hypothetical protein